MRWKTRDYLNKGVQCDTNTVSTMAKAAGSSSFSAKVERLLVGKCAVLEQVTG